MCHRHYGVGTQVRVVNVRTGGNFKVGDIVTICNVIGNSYEAVSPYDNKAWFLSESEIEPIPQTNLEAIRTMTDIELAEFLAWDAGKDACLSDKCSKGETCPQCYLKWLHSPCTINKEEKDV